MKKELLSAVAAIALLAGAGAANAQTEQRDQQPSAKGSTQSQPGSRGEGAGQSAPSAAPSQAPPTTRAQSGGTDKPQMDGAKGQTGAGSPPQAQQSDDRAKGKGDDGSNAASRERGKDSDSAQSKSSGSERKASEDHSRGERKQDRAGDDRDKGNGGSADRREDDQRKGRAERDRDDDQRKGRAERDRDDDQRKGRAERDRDDDQRKGRAERDRDDDQRKGRAERDRDDDQRKGRADRDDDRDRDRVRLSSRDETRVREVFTRTDIRRTTNVNFNIAVGVSVPRSVELYALPAAVIEIVPQYRGYRYVAVEDEIIIVHPETYRVVEVVTISGSGGRQAVRGGGGGGARLEFTADQRQRIRTYALQTCRTVVTAPRFDLSVGVRLPETYELCPFDDVIVSDVQIVRPYRYIVVENEIVVIDPETQTIVEVIR